MDLKNKMAALIASALFAILMITQITLTVSAENDTEPHSWYVMRAPDHEQPKLEGSMKFILDHGGYYVDTNHSGTEDPVLYLTFDAGYENGNVERILDVLKEKNVPGAFFILDNMIDRFPELVMRMRDEGHLVCNHTSKHHDMSKCCDFESFSSELSSLSDKYKALSGDEMPKYYRPPEGRFSERNLVFAEQLGYKTIFWSFAYADWDNNSQPSRDAAMKKILDNTHNGAVILLHPTSSTNASILGDLIDEWRRLGYRFGTLDELTCGAK